VARIGAFWPVESRVSELGPAIPRIGRSGLGVASAGTGPLGASAATGLLAAFGPLVWPTTVWGARPLNRNGGRLSLRRPSPAQVLEPLVVGVVTEAAAALVPLLLIRTARGIAGLLRDRLTRVILPPGRPRFRDGLRDRRSPGLAESLRRRPLFRVTRLARVLPAGVLRFGVVPSGILPGLGALVRSRPGLVIRGIGRPLVLLFLRPSAAHEVSYP
jgi:hypothetical protein